MAAKAHSDEARLRTVDILVWLYRNRSESFKIADIMGEFDIARGEAQRRVSYMRIWGTVKVTGEVKSHRPGRREKVWCVTRWGRQFAKVAGSTKKRTFRRAANPDDEE